MKKLILLALIVFSVSLSAQTPIFKFKANTLLVTDGVNNARTDVNIKISLDFDNGRCIIYTKEAQIIDFSVERVYTDEDDYKVMECKATDSTYKRIRFNILYNSELESTIFQIIYNDLVYLYICTLSE